VYVDLYHAALQDGDAGVRTAAVRALGLHGRPEQATDLLPMLKDEDRILRWESAVALQRLHNRGVIDALIERLDPEREEDAEVRAAAAVALGQYAEPRVLDALINSLDDADLAVNRATGRSLETLTGQTLGGEAGPWLTWVRQAEDPFADKQPFEYPVFQRDRRFVEWVVPWMDPPNEVAAAPAGYDPPTN
jgi:HEAT repeat protein